MLFAALLVLFWSALAIGGEAVGGQRWFVWSVFILVDIYSTVMVGIFWTYTNDIVSTGEADQLYGPIGVGGTVGGIVGGASVDSLVRLTGPVNLLLLSATLCAVSAVIVSVSERTLHPYPRLIKPAAGGDSPPRYRGCAKSRAEPCPAGHAQRARVFLADQRIGRKLAHQAATSACTPKSTIVTGDASAFVSDPAATSCSIARVSRTASAPEHPTRPLGRDRQAIARARSSQWVRDSACTILAARWLCDTAVTSTIISQRSARNLAAFVQGNYIRVLQRYAQTTLNMGGRC